MHNTQVKDLKWDVAMMPVIDAAKRTNSMVGGASLWVMEGKSTAEYEAAAAFLKYVTAPDTGEKYIAENTGYIPVTTKGYELLKADGFYKDPKRVNRDIAIASLTASDVTPLSRGIRLGNFTSVRAELRLKPGRWGMKINRPSYAVYSPPVVGLPFLAVVLAPEGTTAARPFDTAEDAAAFNRLMAYSEHPGKVRN